MGILTVPIWEALLTPHILASSEEQKKEKKEKKKK